jgi:hypothetical protein
LAQKTIEKLQCDTSKVGVNKAPYTSLNKYIFTMQPSNSTLPIPTYKICVQEELDNDLAEWFNPLNVHHEPDGATTLTVPVRDQAELHGLLTKIRDLNLTLIAIVNI